jgi:L-iditol 2-dehydrogenase
VPVSGLQEAYRHFLKKEDFHMATMKQQVMTEPGKIEFREVEIPKPGPDQVLVKIKRIGICGSDIHVFHGSHPYTKYPITQGHEVSAQIVECGAYAKKYAVGQRVVIEPQVYCGHCYPCLHGKYNLCEELKVMGFQTTGMASEYFAVDESKCTPIPDNMTYDQGAMIEPLAVTVHAVKRFSDIKGANVCIEGCGPIGLLLAQSAKALGAKKVIITDILDVRLELAKSVDVDGVVNTKKVDFGEALVKEFGSDKADVIYDCAGNDITMNAAIQNARKGSTIILVAVFGKMANVDLAKLNDSELDLNTSMMYRHEDYVDAIRLVSEGKIKLAPLMTNHFAFENYQDAYKFIDDNRETTMKVFIDVDPEA